jgi:hypothetical protein
MPECYSFEEWRRSSGRRDFLIARITRSGRPRQFADLADT